MNRSIFSKKISQFKQLARKIVKRTFSSQMLNQFKRLGKELQYVFGKKQLIR